MSPTRILIVDDHAIVRHGLVALLRTAPNLETVAEAEDVDSAVAMVAGAAPHVVLLDLSMPGTQGVDAIRRLRAAAPTARIIALTMHDDPVTVRAVLAAGAAGFLSKSVAGAELLNAVRTVVAGRTYVAAPLEADLPTPAPVPEVTPTDVLSARELEVLRLVAGGHTNKEIAQALAISVKSVETYRARVAEKLRLRSRAELVRYAIRHGLLGRG